MNYVYKIIVVICTWTITLGPGQNELHVVPSVDSLHYEITDSCTAMHCYNNIVPNVGTYNYQTNQMIIGLELTITNN